MSTSTTDPVRVVLVGDMSSTEPQKELAFTAGLSVDDYITQAQFKPARGASVFVAGRRVRRPGKRTIEVRDFRAEEAADPADPDLPPADAAVTDTVPEDAVAADGAPQDAPAAVERLVVPITISKLASNG